MLDKAFIDLERLHFRFDVNRLGFPPKHSLPLTPLNIPLQIVKSAQRIVNNAINDTQTFSSSGKQFQLFSKYLHKFHVIEWCTELDAARRGIY